MRQATLSRQTAETQIQLALNLDGQGRCKIQTGMGFLDHMLTLLCFHARMDLDLTCRGDLEVDAHHSAEDIGIALGQALAQAAGDKRGIARYGHFLLPMDEALVLIACDLSGRGCLGWSVDLPAQRVGDFDTELGKEFFLAFVRSCPITLHLRQLAGENSHHIIEAAFKGVGRALRQALAQDPAFQGQAASSKGTLV